MYIDQQTRRWIIAKLYQIGFCEKQIEDILVNVTNVRQCIQDDLVYAAKQCTVVPIPQGEAAYQAQIFCLVEMLAQLKKNDNENMLIGILCNHLEITNLNEFLEGIMMTIYQQSHIVIPLKHIPFGNLLEAVIEMSIMHTNERLTEFLAKDQLCAHVMAYAKALVKSDDVMPKNKQELKYSLAKYLTKRYQSLCTKVMSWQWDDGSSGARMSLLCGRSLTANERDVVTLLFGLSKKEPMSVDNLAIALRCPSLNVEEYRESALKKLRTPDFLEQVLSHPKK